ncbi:hypothetical protein IE077_000099 [Cardiosporidium cionae]|uniref:Uncharacterized protein n=1 Tax=Cardiosporidium cionae TaxID=476202 RepID=A0ABQ7J5T2_9APIC|nr:hypothetical protein IE077_000099 [Cardiosporidium cionae]|eukprot:KAF8819323.1 hypothetical protein IE077_000099 [Cardiosporidium cionae]
MIIRTISTVWRNCAPSGTLPEIRRFATMKSAHPETPLHYYTATSYATASINHRMFYINWIAMIFLIDVFSGTLDF